MNKKTRQPKKSFSFIIAGLLIITANSKSILPFGGDRLIPIPIDPTFTFESDGPTNTPMNTKPAPTRATRTNTPSPTATPTLITGVLACITVAPGVTCTNNGSYLDYSININVTGLTGGATAGYIIIGTYTRSTNGGYMGMMSNFVHSETSGWPLNTVSSQVFIHPFDAGGVGYTGFTSGAGTNVSVTNKTTDWRYIGGSGGWPNTLSVGGNVDWPITGYSIVGHIYLYSNQSFVTGTPTPTRTATATRTPTKTPTPTSTATFIPGTPHRRGSGVCWESGRSWASSTIYYDIDTSIPLSWEPSIEAAAETWNIVSPSSLVFIRQPGSTNKIRLDVPQRGIAGTAAGPVGTFYIGDAYTVFDPGPVITWDTNNITPSVNDFNVQSTMTHEFGHWLFLFDIVQNPNCLHVTMDSEIKRGEIEKIDLAFPDMEAINWQYP